MIGVRRFQFGLPLLFILTAAVAVFCWASLQIIAHAPKLNLSANEWWAIGAAAAIAFVVTFAVLWARR